MLELVPEQNVQLWRPVPLRSRHSSRRSSVVASRSQSKARGRPAAESPSQQAQATADKSVGGTKDKGKGKSGDQKPVMCKYAKNPALGSCPEGNNCKHWHKESAYQRALEAWQSRKTASPKVTGKAEPKKGGGKGRKHGTAGTETATEANGEDDGWGRPILAVEGCIRHEMWDDDHALGPVRVKAKAQAARPKKDASSSESIVAAAAPTDSQAKGKKAIQSLNGLPRY